MAVNKITQAPTPIDTLKVINAIVESLSDYLPSDELTAAINAALQAAHDSGQFDGANGTNAYVHIRYGATANPATPSTTPNDYMGIYSGTSATAPTTSSSYTWYKIKGDTGAGGKTAYQSAQDGGYTGTETEFNALLAGIPIITTTTTDITAGTILRPNEIVFVVEGG